MTRIPYLRHSSKILSSRALPSAPTSLKPAETIIMDLTPALPQSSTLSMTSSAGITITARSGFSGKALTFG